LTYVLVLFAERLDTRLADAMNSGRIGLRLLNGVKGAMMMRRIPLFL
jgi:hypothetical protein